MERGLSRSFLPSSHHCQSTDQNLQSRFGIERYAYTETNSVCVCMCVCVTTPPKPLNRFAWKLYQQLERLTLIAIGYLDLNYLPPPYLKLPQNPFQRNRHQWDGLTDGRTTVRCVGSAARTWPCAGARRCGHHQCVACIRHLERIGSGCPICREDINMRFYVCFNIFCSFLTARRIEWSVTLHIILFARLQLTF